MVQGQLRLPLPQPNVYEFIVRVARMRNIHFVSTNSRSLLTRIPAFGAAIFGLLVIVLTFHKFANEPLMVGDLSTYVLPADALLRKGDAVYVDFFDIKPPITYLMFIPWIAVFGKGLLGMWIYYSVWLVALFSLTWLLLRRFLAGWVALVLFFTLGATLVTFRMLEEILFITEVVGLTLAFAAVFILLKWPSSWISYASAGFLTIAAGQTKEVFVLTPLILIPAVVFVKQQRLVNAAAFLGGGATCLGLILGTLLWWNPASIPEYLRIVTFKSERFPPPSLGEIAQGMVDIAQEIRAWIPLIALLLVILLALLILSRISPVEVPSEGSRQHDAANRRAVWVVGTFSVSILFAFIWQGAPPRVHYAVALVFPLTLVLAPLLRWGLTATRKISHRPIRISLSVLLLVSILPATSSVLWIGGRSTALDPVTLGERIGQLEAPDATATYDRIADLTSEDDCIHVAYGWAASAAYLYSERDPCSRFIVPPLALDQTRIDEMQDALIENPPALLLVNGNLAGETTYPEESGSPDDFVFPFQSVVNTCYEPVEGEPTLYLPTEASTVALSECIAGQVQAMRVLTSKAT